ncbi:DUF3515 family protein [Arthrobacter sp. KK5.5]|uniref:DUF3515 family protein n=1 Tax=Arthrobacter sp. KK5.5 TaxID=3373084 RepID=UPI003EE74F43
MTSLGLAVSVFGLSSCAPPVDVEAADAASHPVCAEMMVALPDELAGAGLRATNSQATAVWGEPAQIILRCGVTPPSPTTDPCISVNGIDWLAREGEPAWTLTTYGREPATEILFDPDVVASSTVLAEISAAAGRIPADGACTTLDQSVDLP